MNIFLSHARKDSALALDLADQLKKRGLTVLHPDPETAPGENWAMKLGKALQDSDFMVILLTPGALDADWLRQDIEFALGSKKYEGHVFSVLVGLMPQAGKDVPWVLLKLPHRVVDPARRFGEVAEEILLLCGASEKSSAHA